MDKKEISLGNNTNNNKKDSSEEELGVVTKMRTAEVMLRLIPIALCISALVLMLKDSQTNDYGTLSYSNLTPFKYLVHANGICAGYSLLSAVVVAMARPATMPRAWTFFFLDQVLTYMILGAGSVSTEVLNVAKKGDAAITWTAECNTFGGFCDKAMASIVITFLVVACYALLSLVILQTLQQIRCTHFELPWQRHRNCPHLPSSWLNY